MRIISNFKDYYDCMQANGFDPMIVYMRTKKPQFIPDNGRTDYRFPYHGWSRNTNDFEYCKHSIGFCGKWYLYFEVFNKNNDLVLQTYNIDDIDKFVEKNFSDKQKEVYYKKDYKWGRAPLTVFRRAMIVDDIFKHENPERRDLNPDEVFIKNNTPIIVHHERKTEGAPEGKCYVTTYDDCLKDYSFFRVMEPWQAYQELSMFVGGPLVNSHKTIPEMDNKTKVQSHGFDKYSFRQDPKVKK